MIKFCAELQEVAAKYSQLIELEVVCWKMGHPRMISHPLVCEPCCNLLALRSSVEAEDRSAVEYVIRATLIDLENGGFC